MPNKSIFQSVHLITVLSITSDNTPTWRGSSKHLSVPHGPRLRFNATAAESDNRALFGVSGSHPV